jgi:hypothetical protein
LEQTMKGYFHLVESLIRVVHALAGLRGYVLLPTSSAWLLNMKNQWLEAI